MDPSKKDIPAFLVFGGGFVFLAGLAVGWIIDASAPRILSLFGHSTTTGLVVATSSLVTMGVQWLLVIGWRWRNAPRPPRHDDEPIRLTPDKRERLQTGQGA